MADRTSEWCVPPEIVIGSKIHFAEEKRPYTVRAVNDRFAICTKPFNPKRTFLYTIVDFKERVRGTENLIFCMGFETDEQCREALARLCSGESAVSHRNRIPLRLAGQQQCCRRTGQPGHAVQAGEFN